MFLITNWMCWVKDHINWVTLHFFWFRINCFLLSRLSQGHEDQVLHSSFASQHNWGHRGCPIPDLHWTVPGFAFPRASARGNWLNNLRQYKVQPGCLHPAFIYYILACLPFPKRPHSSPQLRVPAALSMARTVEGGWVCLISDLPSCDTVWLRELVLLAGQTHGTHLLRSPSPEQEVVASQKLSFVLLGQDQCLVSRERY